MLLSVEANLRVIKNNAIYYTTELLANIYIKSELVHTKVRNIFDVGNVL